MSAREEHLQAQLEVISASNYVSLTFWTLFSRGGLEYRPLSASPFFSPYFRLSFLSGSFSLSQESRGLLYKAKDAIERLQIEFETSRRVEEDLRSANQQQQRNLQDYERRLSEYESEISNLRSMNRSVQNEVSKGGH